VRQQFQDVLRQLRIKNDKHYDCEISKNNHLRHLENLMPPSAIQTVKRNVFNQNMLVEPENYLDLVFKCSPITIEQNVCKKAYHLWMQKLSDKWHVLQTSCFRYWKSNGATRP